MVSVCNSNSQLLRKSSTSAHLLVKLVLQPVTKHKRRIVNLSLEGWLDSRSELKRSIFRQSKESKLKLCTPPSGRIVRRWQLVTSSQRIYQVLLKYLQRLKNNRLESFSISSKTRDRLSRRWSWVTIITQIRPRSCRPCKIRPRLSKWMTWW